jgi:hypothetical protein
MSYRVPRLAPRVLPLLLLIAGLTPAAVAGPQHWGFGFGYLVTLEENDQGTRVLSVYEPPVHIKDADWLLRWRDASGQYQEALPGGLAVGNFWPETMGGKEYLVALCQTKDRGLVVRVYDPPEVFSTRAWKMLGEVAASEEQRKANIPPLTHLGGNEVVACGAGDVLGLGRDQLCVLAVQPGDTPRYSLGLYTPPEKPDGSAWTLHTLLGLIDLEKLDPQFTGKPSAMLVGDFWGQGEECVMLSFGPAQAYVRFDGGRRMPMGKGQGSIVLGKPKLVAKSTWPGAAPDAQHAVACDFLKDGFAYLASLAPAAPPIEFSVAPRQAQRYKTCWVRPDETFAGAKLTDQQLGQTKTIMKAGRQAPAGKVVAVAAGRIFGYITASVDVRKEKLWKPWAYHGHNDVEISFAHRTPVYRLGVPKEWQDGDWPWEPDGHFGWPFKDEDVTYEVSIKNNGPEPIPAGQVTLRAWVSTKDRNADLLEGKGTGNREQGTADFSFTIDQPIPPFDPAKPEYTVVKIPLKWPFDQVQPEGWTWKKINVRNIGERWLVLRADYAADVNERNNRYELALNSLLFRPVLRFDIDAPPHPTPEGIEGKPERKINTLAWRAPVVLGDPESKEYNGRKLADAVTCMWERSRTSDGQDVWWRYVFDSYRLCDWEGRGGYPRLSRTDDWSYYEAPRENEHWLGLWGDYERFDPADGGAECHETGHLGHRIGDLYHYFVNPINLRGIRMADGSPVQMDTYAWGLDSFCSGHAILGEATCDLHRYMEGVRYGGGWGWHQMLPDQIRVRVLDRDGQPVASAKLNLWLHSQNKLYNSGVTDAQGVWDPEFPRKKGADSGEQPYRLFDPLNIKLWKGEALDALAQVFTVELPGYCDFMIWGAEETHAHSRYTLMHESLIHRDGWTWDFHTLYKAGAPEPRFDVTAAVQGREVVLSVAGAKADKYRLYRRWEPTYVFERVADVDAKPAEGGATQATFRDDMGAQDWYMKGRYRATYYVTQVTGDTESLPKRVYGIAMDKVNSVAAVGDDAHTLLVALNCGKAEPFGVLCQGTTPAEEFVKHFRFGHTAAKLAPSRVAWPQRCFATLTQSDLGETPRFFDLIQFDKPDRREHHYAVVHTIAECDVTDCTGDAPQIITINPDREASCAVNIGDWAEVDERLARIVAVAPVGGAEGKAGAAAPLKLTLEKPLFKADQKGGRHVAIVFGAGTPGARAELRELQKPRGLATLAGATDADEFVALADTGNGRIVVWTGALAYLTAWQPEEPGFHPVAVAASPTAKGEFFVLDRRADRNSRLHHLRLAEKAIEQVEPPLTLDVGDGEAGPEIGLAVYAAPGSNGQWSKPDGKLHIAVTDAAKKRVLEYGPVKTPLGEPAVLTNCTGTFVGDAALGNPTDVAYSLEGSALRLYCVDGHNRLVRLR